MSISQAAGLLLYFHLDSGSLNGAIHVAEGFLDVGINVALRFQSNQRWSESGELSQCLGSTIELEREGVVAIF